MKLFCLPKRKRVRSKTEINSKMESDSSWMIPIELMLGSLNHVEVQACSISSVPDDFRDQVDNIFKPKVISIGPLHRGATRQMQSMEETKWLYMSEFLNRIEETQGEEEINEIQGEEKTKRLRDCGSEILKLDKVIRASYGGNIKLKPHEFAKIMIVDGCFLIELLIRLGNYMTMITNGATNHYSNDPIFNNENKLMSVLNDIMMLENQIPFFVLKKLYRKIFPDESKIKDDDRVADLARKAFNNYNPSLKISAAGHVLHLMHMSTSKTIEEPRRLQQQNQKGARKELVRCATRLQAAGIIIRAKENSTNVVPHKLEDNFNFNISFEGRILKIPPLRIKETTEVKWRNLIAWEQSKNWVSCIYTSYALFFQGLICCKHDIKLLEENKVIVNERGASKQDLLTMFQAISKGAEHMDPRYSEICERLNKNHGTIATKVLQELPKVGWHQARRVWEIIVYFGRKWLNLNVLIRDHIPTGWKLIALLAATLLLILTIMQTIYSSRSSG